MWMQQLLKLDLLIGLAIFISEGGREGEREGGREGGRERERKGEY